MDQIVGQALATYRKVFAPLRSAGQDRGLEPSGDRLAETSQPLATINPDRDARRAAQAGHNSADSLQIAALGTNQDRPSTIRSETV
jgi:hypothetical protein